MKPLIRFKPLLAGTSAALMLLAQSAQAAPRYPSGPQFYETARVVEVVPQYREIRVSNPVRDCKQVPVTTVHRQEAKKSPGGMLVGGLLGAAIGHQIGGGDGRKLATAVGTIVGANIGHEAANSDRHDTYTEHTTLQESCEYYDEVSYDRQFDGYKVSYRYRGNTYTTVMDEDPGDSIRLRVQLTPVGH